VEYSKSQSPGLIRSGNRGSDYGDWLSINADTNKELIGTAYFAYSTSLVAKAAAALGKTADATTYQELFQAIKRAFIAKYVSADGHVAGNTQCGLLMALKFDLLPEPLRARAADLLEADITAKGDHLSTGFVGVSYLLPELTKAGKLDTAYRLLLQDGFPSWLFSVKMGATTIWERWDGWTPDKGFQDPGMNSFNHYSLGSCGEWLYATVAGIDCDPAAPGFKRIIIRPRPGGGLTEAAGRYQSIHGRITSAWTLKNGGFTLDVEIPANTTATVHVPAKAAAGVRESGKPAAQAEGVTFLRMEDGAAVFAIGSGTYRFSS
jgi:alpha-L-rhamnosidase